MRKVLVPVDGSSSAERAVRYVVALSKTYPALEVVLVNIQLPVANWEVGSFLKKEEVEAVAVSRGGDTLQPARALLEAAGVRYTPVVLIGPAGELIVNTAIEHQCDGIVMGTRGMGNAANMLLGSVSSEVIQRAEIPVTLIK